MVWYLLFTRVWCHNNTFVRYPFGIHNSCLSLHTSFAEFLVGGFGRVAVDPERSLPTPTTEAGGTKQQSSICTEAQEKLWHVRKVIDNITIVYYYNNNNISIYLASK